MSLRKMVPFLFGSTILASGAISLAGASNNNNNLQTISTQNIDFVSQVNKETKFFDKNDEKNKFFYEVLNNYQEETLSTDNNNQELKNTVLSSSQNYYKWYYIYHVIGLSNDVLKMIDDHLKEGVTAIAALISAVIPGFAPFAPVFALAVTLQWSFWDLPNYAKEGKAVEIKMIGGVAPQIIVSVSEQ